MSQVDEILNGLTDEQIAALTADPVSEPHIVVGADRFITVPDALKRIAVQFEHDIETVTFDCPRYWDGLDMSKMSIRISYMRSDGYCDAYVAKNVTVDPDDDTIMHFEWTISGNVTQVKGTLSFLVCIKKTGADGININHWSSELNKEMYISEGLECEETILSGYPDIVTQVLLAAERAHDISATLEEHYKNGDFELGLPMVDENDNGRILRVENGAWATGEMKIFEGGVVEETNNSTFIRYSANADGSDFTATWQPGQSYIGIAAAISAPVSASAYTWVRMIAPLSQNMYGNALVGSEKGEIIRVDDVSPIEHAITAKVRSKNLLKYPYAHTTMTTYGVTITDNGDGSIAINGTATNNIEFMFRNMVTMQPGTYKYSLFGTEDVSGLSGNVQKRTTSGSWVANLSNSKTHNGIFTLTDADMGYLCSFNLYIISGTVINNITVYPQLEPGDTQTEYEPYIDPSTVTVTRCGKNLWSYRPSVTKNGVTITTDENGRIKYSGTCTSSFVVHEVVTLPAGTYTLSDRAVGNRPDTIDARTQIYIPSTGFDKRIEWSDAPNKAVTFTLTKAYTEVCLRIKGATGFTYNDYSITPLLEVGPEMTDHESYRSETYTPAADGTVDILSVSPTMTLFTDKEGAVIDIQYNIDSNRILGATEEALDSIIAMQEELMMPNGDEVSY